MSAPVDISMNASQPEPRQMPLQEQLQACNQQIEAGEPTAVTYIRRGLAYAGLGLLAEAMEDFTQAIALDPTCVEALEQRSRLHELANCQAQAIDDLNRVVELEPEQHQAHLRLGDIYLERQDYLASTAAYTRALLLDGSLWNSYRNRALARLGAGDLDGALQDFSRAIEMAPGQGSLLAGRGNVHLAKKDRAAAVEDFRAAMTLHRRAGNAVAAEELLSWIECPPMD